ncbi:chemotaxis response regulator [Rheinheimera sp. A13L]|uniref:chemotaxis protein CheB n=1 Tax=Rheinheimera sp. A13L TaxID=506534 RepID=UPI000212493D|nr:chemotaxis protein CheB [Rheinheimera sp. A13L]EGM76437.1 chemotaxis response regulator [Rheinheimera sp. A13L]
MAKKLIAVQLSGLGQNKAEGINTIRRSDKLYLVQDPDIACIGPMPDAVRRLSLQHCILGPHSVAIFINHLQRDKSLSLSQKESE